MVCSIVCKLIPCQFDLDSFPPIYYTATPDRRRSPQSLLLFVHFQSCQCPVSSFYIFHAMKHPISFQQLSLLFSFSSFCLFRTWIISAPPLTSFSSFRHGGLQITCFPRSSADHLIIHSLSSPFSFFLIHRWPHIPSSTFRYCDILGFSRRTQDINRLRVCARQSSTVLGHQGWADRPSPH